MHPKTIILHGTGRSGTSMLNNILVNHPDLAWISNYQVYALGIPQISFANRWVKHSVDLNQSDRSKYLIHSSNEPYALWQKFYPNFNETNSLPIGEPFKMEKFVDRIIKYAGKKRFITKVTGESRASFIDHAFSDYKVVWIDRNPIAVISSMMKQRWFFKNRTELFEKITFEEKVHKYLAFYKNSIESKKSIDPHHLLEVKYEDMTSSPVNFFIDLFDELNLRADKDFFKTLEKWHISPVNMLDYKKKYNPQEWDVLIECLKEPIKEYSDRK